MPKPKPSKRHRKPSETLPVLYLRMPAALGRDLRRAAKVMAKLSGSPVTLTTAALTILAAGARDLLSVEPSKASKLGAAPMFHVEHKPRKLAARRSKLATIPEAAP